MGWEYNKRAGILDLLIQNIPLIHESIDIFKRGLRRKLNDFCNVPSWFHNVFLDIFFCQNSSLSFGSF